MNETNRIRISGPLEILFSLAADISRWPEILPHYRWVKILERREGRVVAEMAARHRGLPLWWRTVQRPRPEERLILFTHIGGITRGMEVRWTFEPVGETPLGPTWLVEIHHRFHPRWPPPLGPWLADRIIGRFFVKEVANKTLRRIKEMVESAPRSVHRDPRSATAGAAAMESPRRFSGSVPPFPTDHEPRSTEHGSL